MTALEWLIQLHEVCQFQTKEGKKVGPASNSELRRWLKNGVVKINNVKIAPETLIPEPEEFKSIVFFGNNASARITLL